MPHARIDRIVVAVALPIVGVAVRMIVDAAVGPIAWYLAPFLPVLVVTWWFGPAIGLLSVVVTAGLAVAVPGLVDAASAAASATALSRPALAVVDGALAVAIGWALRRAGRAERFSRAGQLEAVESVVAVTRHVRILAAMTEELGASLSPLQVADVLARRVMEVSGASGVRVVLVPHDVSAGGIAESRGDRGSIDAGIVGPPFGVGPSHAIPLVSGSREEVVGRLEIWERHAAPAPAEAPAEASTEAPEGAPAVEPADMDPEVAAVLAIVGRVGGAAIVRSRLVAGQRTGRGLLDRAGARVARIRALSADLASAVETHDIARAIVDQTVDEVGAGVGLVYLGRADGRTLELIHSRGYPIGLASRDAVIDIDAALPAAAVARTGERLIVGSWDEWRTGHPGASDVLGMTGSRSLVALPLGVETSRAVLVLHFPGDGPPPAEDLEFLAVVGEQGGLALERARLYDALRDRDERLAVTLGASRMGTWELDTGTDDLALSGEFRQLHRLAHDASPTGLEGFLGLVAAADRELVRSALTAAIATDGRYEIAYRIEGQDGVPAWVAGVGRVFPDPAGRTNRIMGTERDITAQVRAEAERDRLLDQEREARHLQEAFVGVVSHELRTPITTLVAGSKILQRDPSLSASARDLATDVEAEADRLYRLVEDLLVLTRLERGNLEVGVEPVHLRHLVGRMVAAEQARWPATRFVIEPTDGTHLGRGEETYVEQVLRNLLANAAKYSPPGSTIRVLLEPSDREIAVRVLDEGPGVEADELDQLFTLFYRSPRTAAKASGAGIGLFVCQRLLLAMDGRTWARRRDEGGSEFGFALQVYDEIDDWVEDEELPADRLEVTAPASMELPA